MDEVVSWERNRLNEIEEDILYESAWLIEARSMIVTKKYKDIPDEVFEHISFTGDDGVFYHDDMSQFQDIAGEDTLEALGSMSKEEHDYYMNL